MDKIILSKKICLIHNVNYILSPIWGLGCPKCIYKRIFKKEMKDEENNNGI